MEVTEIRARLEIWAKIINSARDQVEWFSGAGMQPEAPIMCAIFDLMDRYSSTLCELMGIEAGEMNWLYWYACENHMGKDGKEAGYDGDLRKIKTLDDLAWLVARELSGNEKSRDGHSTTGPTENSASQQEA